MSFQSAAKAGGKTIAYAATDSSAVKTLGDANSRFIIISNAGSNPAVFNTGDATLDVTFPTTGGSGVSGKVILPGSELLHEKNNANDTSFRAKCDSGLTTTLYIQSAEGR